MNGGHIRKWRFIFHLFVAVAPSGFGLALESNDHLVNKQILANGSTETTKQQRNTQIARERGRERGKKLTLAS